MWITIIIVTTVSITFVIYTIQESIFQFMSFLGTFPRLSSQKSLVFQS